MSSFLFHKALNYKIMTSTLLSSGRTFQDEVEIRIKSRPVKSFEKCHICKKYFTSGPDGEGGICFICMKPTSSQVEEILENDKRILKEQLETLATAVPQEEQKQQLPPEEDTENIMPHRSSILIWIDQGKIRIAYPEPTGIHKSREDFGGNGLFQHTGDSIKKLKFEDVATSKVVDDLKAEIMGLKRLLDAYVTVKHHQNPATPDDE